jgi:hypothetical protein
VHVDVLELCRRREHDVSVVGRVGQEDVVDHAEQVVAAEAAPTFVDSGATATGLEL